MHKFIYFHRHGETRYSSNGFGYGNNQYRSLLTERGVREAVALGKELSKHGPFDLYLTSPLPRAVQTATLVHSQLGGCTEFTGEPALSEPIDEKIPEVWERVSKQARQLVNNPHQKILLSTHGYIFYCLTAFFRGLELGELKDFVNPPTASYGWVEFEDGKPVRACRNFTGHLAELDKAAGLVGS